MSAVADDEWKKSVGCLIRSVDYAAGAQGVTLAWNGQTLRECLTAVTSIRIPLPRRVLTCPLVVANQAEAEHDFRLAMGAEDGAWISNDVLLRMLKLVLPEFTLKKVRSTCGSFISQRQCLQNSITGREKKPLMVEEVLKWIAKEVSSRYEPHCVL